MLQLLPAQQLQALDESGCHVGLLLHRQLLDAPLRPPSLHRAQTDWCLPAQAQGKVQSRSTSVIALIGCVPCIVVYTDHMELFKNAWRSSSEMLQHGDPAGL